MKAEAGVVSKDWAALLFRPLIISGMVMCVTAGWARMVEFLFGIWNAGYLTGLVGLLIFETLVIERQLRLRDRLHQEARHIQIHLAEIGLVILLLKGESYFTRGWEQLVQDVQRWIAMPSSFLDPGLVFSLLVTGMMWGLAQSIAANLAEVEDVTNPSLDQELARQSLRDQFLVGAIALLIAVGIQRIRLAANHLSLVPVQISELAVLPVIYVGLGLLLFGQIRFSSLLSRWARERVPVAPGLERRWASWSVVFIGGVSAVALFLPAGDTMLGLYLLLWLGALITFVGQFLVFLILLIILPILSLLMLGRSATEEQAARPPEIPVLPTAPVPAELPEWLNWVRAGIFWLLAALILIFIVRTYWRDRRMSGIWKTLWEIASGGWFAFVIWLRGWVGVAQQVLQRAKPADSRSTTVGDVAWWSQWQARTARERVRRLYLALLQRAAQAGHARRRTQTPYEYSAALKSHLPNDVDALTKLTEAFVQARYSHRNFAPAEVSLLHRLWQRLQSALRRVRAQ